MSPVFDECKKMLVASEVSVISRYFAEWLTERKVVVRASKNVLLNELAEFNKVMADYYSHYDTNGSIMDGSIIQNHFDNVLLDMMSEGLDKFLEFAKLYIEELGSDRITVNKLLKALDVFSHDIYVDMIQNADKGAIW